MSIDPDDGDALPRPEHNLLSICGERTAVTAAEASLATIGVLNDQRLGQPSVHSPPLLDQEPIAGRRPGKRPSLSLILGAEELHRLLRILRIDGEDLIVRVSTVRVLAESDPAADPLEDAEI